MKNYGRVIMQNHRLVYACRTHKKQGFWVLAVHLLRS